MNSVSQKTWKQKKAFVYLAAIASLAVFMLFCKIYSYAEDAMDYMVSPDTYEVQYPDVFDFSDEYKVHSFSYGQKELGSLSLTGEIENVTEYSGRMAYISDNTIEVHYTYGGELHSDDSTEWNICSADTVNIDDYVLKSKVSEGALVIQKSADGENWENAVDPTCSFLAKEKDNLIVYTIEDDERVAGTFYRIILAYEVKRKVEDKADFSLGDLDIDVPFVDSDEYEFLCCTQIYEFYVCSKECPVILRDVISGEDVSSNTSVGKGFQIDKRGSKAKVSVTYDGEIIDDIQSYESFYLPGDYTVDIKTPLKDVHQYRITVEEGLAFETLTPSVYENTKKNGYKDTAVVDGKPVSGIKSYSTLKLGYAGNSSCVEGSYFKTRAYGITGDSVCFFLSLDQKRKLKENGWEIQSDSWGTSKSDKIYGVSTGQIGTGAVIVQTSKDGQNWVIPEKLGYADGLFNTDFEASYGTERDVLLYTPAGTDVVNGVYIRIVYAYMTHGTEEDTEYRYLENYTFFLCSNELGAVTIHNLSTEKPLAEALADKDDNQAEVFIRSEDMLSGSGTVTGFSIDKQLNPVAKYSIAKDGETMNIIGGETFTETGRYDITLSNFFGTEETMSVYVDRMSTKEAYELYFGESLLKGKRIYSEGDLPVYEGGQVSYHLNAITDSYLPMSGTITNLSTGNVIEIDASREERKELIVDAGSYEAVFTDNPFAESEDQSGDYRTFTFHFEIIELGKAPGPVVNQRILKQFNEQNFSGCRQHAYALIYQSASKGNITILFSSEKAAYEYAAKYESGIVEVQKDGSYRYTGSFLVNKKTEYNSNWDVNDAIDYFARLAIQDWYFDLSDEYTYRTLKEETLEAYDNLRTLELDKSVVLFATEEDRSSLADLDALPIINSFKYAFLEPGIEGNVDRGKNHFEFIKDENGWDSSTVVIIDSNGNEYPIEYEQDVDEQLKTNECAPGIVTVQEKTVYGDQAKYQAVYLPENKNLSTVTITYYEEGEEKTEVLKQRNDGFEISADAFKVTSVEDETDPYSLIKVTGGSRGTEYYTPETIQEKEWAEPGDYQLKFINRLGYSYSVNIHIEKGVETDISFTGEEADELQSFTVTFGDQNIQLPEVERYGYDFTGYRDNYGNVYSKEIEQILYKGSLVLETVWEPKNVKVILERPDGEVYKTDEADFGTTYRLGAYISDNKQEHVNGWLYDGQLYTDSIQIDKEDDYVLRVSTDNISSENQTEGVEEVTERSLTNELQSEMSETEEKTDHITRKAPENMTEMEKEAKAAEKEDTKVSANSGGKTIIIIILIASALIVAVLLLKKRSGKPD